jgi:hypothetical protein
MTNNSASIWSFWYRPQAGKKSTLNNLYPSINKWFDNQGFFLNLFSAAPYPFGYAAPLL